MYFFETYCNVQKIIKQEIIEQENHPVKQLKKSLSVGETMKLPSEYGNFISILSKEDSGHNISFSDKEKKEAYEFFQYNNYYNFSVFPRLLPEKEIKYSFSDALKLYYIDEFLSSKIHYFTARIEKWIKTSLAYNLSHMYESEEYAKAECYLDPNIYNSEKMYIEIVTNFSETLHSSKELFIKHHFKQRNGCIPIWVLVEELTFGQIDTFISGLNSTYKNDWVDLVFGRNNRKYIFGGISVCRHLRNIAAHHGRFFGRKFTVTPKIRKEDKRTFQIKDNEKNNLFVALFVVKFFVSFQTGMVISEWNKFIADLKELLDENSSLIDYQLIGFKENWYEYLTIYPVDVASLEIT